MTSYELCMVIDKRPDEPHPVARYYYDPIDVDDWSAAVVRETREGYTVTLSLVSRDNAGVDFDTRVAGTA